MQLSFLKLAAAYLSVFGCASQALASPLMEVLSITLTGNNYQGAVSNNAVSGGIGINALKEPDCADPSKATPLYRAWKGVDNDHFYTADKAEYERAASVYNYALEGIAGYVFPDAQPGTAPLYRLWNGQAADHFYTMSADERDRALGLGYASEGIVGYVYTPSSGPFCGSKPLNRLYKGPVRDHFYTVSEEEKNGAIVKYGYSDEGVVGWVLRF
ncbi:hypothetical protein MD484_g3881, partial [Candolleomyces efflorescens]